MAASLQQSKRSMLSVKCGNLYQTYGSRPSSSGSTFIFMYNANDSHGHDKLHVETRKMEGVSSGGFPHETRQATRPPKGKAACGLEDQESRGFVVTGVAFVLSV